MASLHAGKLWPTVAQSELLIIAAGAVYTYLLSIYNNLPACRLAIILTYKK